jgi:hypothetical protein
LAGGVLPPEVAQLAAVFQFASVLPTQVLVAALADRVVIATPTSAPNRLFTDLFFTIYYSCL